MIAIWEVSTGYQIMGIAHILAAIVAFGPLFFYPTLHRAGAAAAIAKIHMRVTMPALTLVWVLGMGLTGMSDWLDYKVADPWITTSILIWLVMMVISWFMIRPALSDSGERARSLLAAGTGITHLLLIVVLYLMVFKPGA